MGCITILSCMVRKYLFIVVQILSFGLSYSQEANDEPRRFTSIVEALSEPGKVEILDLTDQNLTEIPIRLLELTSLKELYLCENANLNLKQAFNLLESVQSLEELWITEANLDSIPAEIGQLQTLKALWLDGNNLTEIPEGVKMLENLEGLSLFSNQIRNVILEEDQLPKLKHVNLCYNEFEVFPTEFVNAERIVMWYNHITTIPKSVKKLTKLKSLNLEHNNIKSVPEELTQLELVELDLGRNYLTEDSIQGLFNIRTLKILDLGSNQIQRISCRIGDLSELERLTLSYNPIKKLPNELSRLSNLEQMGLGQIPEMDWENAFEVLSGIKSLERVGMFRMGLKTMPQGFEKLNQVKVFWLTFNQFDNTEKERIESLIPNAKITFN